ncbi:MAG: threonine synthase [Caldilineaceae bacterium]
MSVQSKNYPSSIRALRCLRCGTEYSPGLLTYVCPCRSNHGSDLGTLDLLYDYAALRNTVNPLHLLNDADHSIGRYYPLLPIDRRYLAPLAVGNTPLLAAPRLAASLELTHLFVKDDGRNPSCSLKDRASAVAVAHARQINATIIATASTGNAAAALASQCAAVGQANVIFVPQSAPPAKIAQLLAYGSTVLAIDGPYDQAFDLCIEACHTFGWYNRNTGYNPYMTEGKKTVAFEIAAQLAASTKQEKTDAANQPPAFQAPDAVFVSVGDGCIIGGVHKGFQDLLALGWITQMPRIYGVQSTASAALYDAWRHDREVPEPVNATTRADSISVNAPRDPIKALHAVRASNGAFLALPDHAILNAILPLARQAAVFAEPAGAAALAGLIEARRQQLVQPDETIVVINTGSGLKDVAAAMQVTGTLTVIPPTLAAVEQALAQAL